MPSQGGNNLAIPLGVQDQRSVEERRDVLVYTSDPMERPLEVTGAYQDIPLGGDHRDGHRLYRQTGGCPSRRVCS